jgi:hypothetical protein
MPLPRRSRGAQGERDEWSRFAFLPVPAGARECPPVLEASSCQYLQYVARQSLRAGGGEGLLISRLKVRFLAAHQLTDGYAGRLSRFIGAALGPGTARGAGPRAPVSPHRDRFMGPRRGTRSGTRPSPPPRAPPASHSRAKAVPSSSKSDRPAASAAAKAASPSGASRHPATGLHSASRCARHDG